MLRRERGLGFATGGRRDAASGGEQRLQRCEAALAQIAEAGVVGTALGVVIPHYDNAEGGTHDTRFCYLGERRLAALEALLAAARGVTPAAGRKPEPAFAAEHVGLASNEAAAPAQRSPLLTEVT